jgi:hypothetical protein
MKWFEFTQDNGDGSYSKLRFKTREEADEAFNWLQENDRYWVGDGDGVNTVDTESGYFWSSLEDLKETYGD